MAKKARLYFRSLKVVLFYLYHLSQLHKIVIRPDVKFFRIANKWKYILFYLLYVGSRKSLNKFRFERFGGNILAVKLLATLSQMSKIKGDAMHRWFFLCYSVKYCSQRRTSGQPEVSKASRMHRQ